MRTFGSFGGTLTVVALTPDEAICAELADRIEAFGGLSAYVKATGEDRRNTAHYMKNKVPTFPTLIRHLKNLDVPVGEFFSAVQSRLDER